MVHSQHPQSFEPAAAVASPKFNAGPDPLRVNAEIHDCFNLEFKIASRLPPEERNKASGALRYEIDAYLFFPVSFGVNAETYPSTRLFHDLKTYLRREPPLLWRSFSHACLGQEDTIDPGPLEILEQSLRELVASDRLQPAEQAQWMHFFGCALRRSMRHMISVFSMDACADPDCWDEDQWLHSLQRFCARLQSICSLLARFRCFRQSLTLLPDVVHPNYEEAALVVDEMASYLLESTLADADALMSRLLRDYPWSLKVHTQIARTQQELLTTARVEMGYRQRQGFLKHTSAPSPIANRDTTYLAIPPREEYFTYRVGQLKKIMDRVLYFDIEQRDTPAPWRHVIGGIGAAFAATWAFIAGTSTGGMGQNTGTSTFVVFCIAVFAYILKDRIKEVSKEKLMGWMRKNRPDRMAVFSGDHVQISNRTRLDGETNESVLFVAPESLPPVVQALRDAGHVIAVDDRIERVLRYKRRVQYSLADGDPFQFEVKDILRLNVQPFLEHLDSPARTMRYFDHSQGGFNTMSATKVYHLNIVLVYRVSNPAIGVASGHDEGWTTYERLRVVLTRGGIARLDRVLPRAEHLWLTRPLAPEPLTGNFDDDDHSPLKVPSLPPDNVSMSPDAPRPSPKPPAAQHTQPPERAAL